MKNIKDITLSIFAIIGFISIITAFNTQPNQQTSQTYSTVPESHVWEFYLANDGTRAYSLNKVSGEIREVNKANYTVLDIAKRQK